VKGRYITWLASPLASISSAGPGNSPNGAASAGPTRQAQRRKFAELLMKGKISNEAFERWNREAGGKTLPEHVKPKPKAKRKGKGK